MNPELNAESLKEVMREMGSAKRSTPIKQPVKMVKEEEIVCLMDADNVPVMLCSEETYRQMCSGNRP